MTTAATQGNAETLDPHMTNCRKCAQPIGNAVLASHEGRCDGPPHICTANAPWTPEKSKRAIHLDAKVLYTDENWMDDADRYECPYCGTRFWVEIPN